MSRYTKNIIYSVAAVAMLVLTVFGLKGFPKRAPFLLVVLIAGCVFQVKGFKDRWFSPDLRSRSYVLAVIHLAFAVLLSVLAALIIVAYVI